MKKLRVFLFSVATLLVVNQTMAEATTTDDGLKYFVVQGKPKPEVIKMMVENPADPWAGAEKLVASIEGAKLIDYYLYAGGAQNMAIIAVPDTKYAAAIVYQRMGTNLMEDMDVKEIIPSRKVKEMLQIANEMNKHDAYLKK